MPLIRLECAETKFAPGLPESLETARDQFIGDHAVNFEEEANLCPRLPTDLSFFALPEQLLLAYEKHRETSELGHIFRIANGLHDEIDAVVMTGSGGGVMGARAIAAACCDPYHNELTRAARGSKPRIYFADEGMDNDQLQSLIGRLSAGGYGDGAAEQTWAIIGTDRATPHAATTSPGRPHLVMDHLVETLASATASVDAELRTRLITTIGPVGSLLHQRLAALGFPQSLRVPDAVEDRHSVFTPMGLLSSAFLGFDCIELLVGAAAINENFRNEPFAKNIVLQFVAANRGCKRFFAWWARSLTGLDRWLETLQPNHWPLQVAVDSDRTVLDRRLDSGSHRSGELVCNHVDVDAIRTDPLGVSAAQTLQRGGDDSQTLPGLQKKTAATLYRRFADAGIRQNKITLPVIDTHSLGQWMQLMMLATTIESALAVGSGSKPSPTF